MMIFKIKMYMNYNTYTQISIIYTYYYYGRKFQAYTIMFKLFKNIRRRIYYYNVNFI